MSHRFDWATVGSGISDGGTLVNIGGLDIVSLLKRDAATGAELDWYLQSSALPTLAGKVWPYVPGSASKPTSFALISGE